MNDVFRWLKEDDFKTANNWRQYTVKEEIAGHTMNYNPNVILASIRGAGGSPYMRKGRIIRHLIYSFLDGKNPDSSDFIVTPPEKVVVEK